MRVRCPRRVIYLQDGGIPQCSRVRPLGDGKTVEQQGGSKDGKRDEAIEQATGHGRRGTGISRGAMIA